MKEWVRLKSATEIYEIADTKTAKHRWRSWEATMFPTDLQPVTAQRKSTTL